MKISLFFFFFKDLSNHKWENWDMVREKESEGNEGEGSFGVLGGAVWVEVI